MAEFTIPYPEPGRNWTAEIRQHNEAFLAQQSALRRGVATPEVLFARHFDNSRLIKAPDPALVRQMRLFAAAITILFSLVMVYGLQHFWSIEMSYRVEAEKQVRNQLREENRQLRLSEAQLTQPGRLDEEARKLGLDRPQPGQVVQPLASPDASAPSVAQSNTPVLPAR
jgi:cell division protein FtsL